MEGANPPSESDESQGSVHADGKSERDVSAGGSQPGWGWVRARAAGQASDCADMRFARECFRRIMLGCLSPSSNQHLDSTLNVINSHRNEVHSACALVLRQIALETRRLHRMAEDGSFLQREAARARRRIAGLFADAAMVVQFHLDLESSGDEPWDCTRCVQAGLRAQDAAQRARAQAKEERTGRCLSRTEELRRIDTAARWAFTVF